MNYILHNLNYNYLLCYILQKAASDNMLSPLLLLLFPASTYLDWF